MICFWISTIKLAWGYPADSTFLYKKENEAGPGYVITGKEDSVTRPPKDNERTFISAFLRV